MRTNLYKLLLDIYSVFQHNPFIYETGEKILSRIRIPICISYVTVGNAMYRTNFDDFIWCLEKRKN